MYFIRWETENPGAQRQGVTTGRVDRPCTHTEQVTSHQVVRHSQSSMFLGVFSSKIGNTQFHPVLLCDCSSVWLASKIID